MKKDGIGQNVLGMEIKGMEGCGNGQEWRRGNGNGAEKDGMGIKVLELVAKRDRNEAESHGNGDRSSGMRAESTGMRLTPLGLGLKLWDWD